MVSMDVPVLCFVIEVVQLPQILRGEGVCTLGNFTLLYLEYNHTRKNLRRAGTGMKNVTGLSVSKAKHVGGNHTRHRWIPGHLLRESIGMPGKHTQPMDVRECMCHCGSHFLSMGIGAPNLG